MKTYIITLSILEIIDSALDAFRNIFAEYDLEMCYTSSSIDKNVVHRNNRGAYLYILCKSFVFKGKWPSFREFFQNIFCCQLFFV